MAKSNAQRQREYRERRSSLRAEIAPSQSVTPVTLQNVTPDQSVTTIKPLELPPVLKLLTLDSALLLPCPFCGGKAFFEDNGNGCGRVFCCRCKACSMPSSQPQDCLSWWNRRV